MLCSGKSQDYYMFSSCKNQHHVVLSEKSVRFCSGKGKHYAVFRETSASRWAKKSQHHIAFRKKGIIMLYSSKKVSITCSGKGQHHVVFKDKTNIMFSSGKSQHCVCKKKSQNSVLFWSVLCCVQGKVPFGQLSFVSLGQEVTSQTEENPFRCPNYCTNRFLYPHK